MAAPSRRTDSALVAHLFAQGYDFNFFQAVRLLALLFPDRQMIGAAARPASELARFRTRLSLAFPASAIHDIEEADEPGRPPRVTISFFGFAGVKGVLPLPFTERLIGQRYARDHASLSFLEIFQHRMVSLFYRAWEKYHVPISYERLANQGAPELDTFTHGIYDLAGLGTRGLRGRMGVRDEALLSYAGLIAQQPHSASALRGILQDYFGVPIAIDQFLGSWYLLLESDLSYLDPEGLSNQLDVGAIAGDAVWDQQARFRVRVGPVSFARFQAFWPDGAAMAELVELTRFFVGPALGFEVQVLLKKDEVPWCRLQDEGDDAPRLGWAAWLKTEEFRVDADEAVFGA